MIPPILIHAAAVDSWYREPLAAELRDRGHEVVAPDLPCDDESAGLAEYADTVVEAIGNRTELVVVAHSFGGFTGPPVCDRVSADLLVMLQAQVPAPGESPGHWWDNTGYGPARQESDRSRGVPEGTEEDPLPLVLTDTPAALASEFMRRMVAERLGFQPDEMPGDHCPLLGHPEELADGLEAYRAAL
ncbi:alpha/beta hydrolase [Streptomyces sp. NPDC052396]|uniref:alpha/beta hydrolase n=1 Tax=Streptomyces sp. NPDC052396 TaxID=3365689 RepID=UPI0037D5E0AE